MDGSNLKRVAKVPCIPKMCVLMYTHCVSQGDGDTVGESRSFKITLDHSTQAHYLGNGVHRVLICKSDFSIQVSYAKAQRTSVHEEKLRDCDKEYS